MKKIDKFNCDTASALEGKFAKVGNTIVGYFCESKNSEGDYPYEHTVIVITEDGRIAKESKSQFSENDSAFYDGFYPTYSWLCRRLGIEPQVE